MATQPQATTLLQQFIKKSTQNSKILFQMLKSQYELFVDFKEQQRQEAEAKKEELQEETVREHNKKNFF